MQSATPRWAHSSGVIKAFKHPPPTAATTAINPPSTPSSLSLHMSALQTCGGWVGWTGGAHVLSVVYLVPPTHFFSRAERTGGVNHRATVHV